MAILVPARMYTVSVSITNPGAVTNLNIQANATKPFAVARVKIDPAAASVPATAGCKIRLVRKTAAPTVTSIGVSTFMNHDPTDADSGVTAGHTASAEGTDGDFIEEGWTSTVGYDFAPTPEEYIVIPAGTANGFGVKSNVAPPAGTYTFRITYHEIG